MSDTLTAIADRWGQFRRRWYATPLILVAIFLFLVILPWIRSQNARITSRWRRASTSISSG